MLRLCLVTPCVWLAFTGLAAPVHAKPPRDHAGEALFTNASVREIHLTLAPEAIRELQRDTREYVRATLREGQVTYTNVGVHLKGTGSFRPIDQKPAFTVKFNKFVEGQDFYGLTKIALNNSVQDATCVNEMLCTELFRAAGVPAARVAHAKVHLNDRCLGVYTIVEGLNKPFLRRHFSDPKGNLYEGHTKDISERLDQDNGEDLTQADLLPLLEAARAPAGERWTKLERVIDLDRFLSMLAGEVLMAHWDGYWLNRNNYSLYFDPSAKRMTFIPHGLDNMFQIPAMAWRPTMQGLLVRAALHTPQGQNAYRERLCQILTNHFQVQALTGRVDAIAGRIRPAFAANELDEFDRNVGDLKRRIADRIRNISQQVSALGTPARFDAAGVASLRSGWSTNVDAGVVIMTEATEDNRPVLKIRHGDTTGSIASWRTRVALDGGRYKFRGRVKAEGLVPVGSPNVGVALRISGTHPPFQIVRDTDWRTIEFEFEVLPPSDDIDLVCELSTVLGEVWFDLASLQLVRLRAERSVVEAVHPIK